MNKLVKIEGMMCKNCQRHVKEALLSFGTSVNVSLEDGTAYIENTEKSNKEITEAIEELGFEVLGISNER